MIGSIPDAAPLKDTPASTPASASAPAAPRPLAPRVQALVEDPALDLTLALSPGLEERLVEDATALADRAYPRHGNAPVDDDARADLHRALHALYEAHLGAPDHPAVQNQHHPVPARVLFVLERAWLAALTHRAERFGKSLSFGESPDDFVDWVLRAAPAHPAWARAAAVDRARGAAEEQPGDTPSWTAVQSANLTRCTRVWRRHALLGHGARVGAELLTRRAHGEPDLAGWLRQMLTLELEAYPDKKRDLARGILIRFDTALDAIG